ncbi:MAG: hypothetical protein ACRC6R_01355 [Bacteroidales bacterium]
MKQRFFFQTVGVLVLFLLLNISNISAAYRMSPLVTNFSSVEYGAGAQNWAVTQDSIGNMYFGNGEGLLQYNGDKWHLYPFVSSSGTIRSLYFEKSTSRIYAGGFEEFGYYSPDGYGGFSYTSLSDKISRSSFKMNNDEIWNIIKVDGTIYFQSFASYFVYENNEVIPVNKGQQFHFFFELEGSIYADVEYEGLSKMDSNGIFTNSDCAKLPSKVINGFKGSHGNIVWVTQNHGLWTQTGEVLKRVDVLGEKWPQANRAYLTHDSLIAVGTHRAGVMMLDMNGRYHWTLYAQNGLRNNTVLNIKEGASGDMWLALDKGIARLHRSSPLSLFEVSSINFGSVYSVESLKGHLYLGTNQGVFEVYMSDSLDLRITPLKGEISQVWDISAFDDQIFVSGTGLTSEIVGTRLLPVSQTSGGTCMVKATIEGEDILLQGSYSDLIIYRKSGNGKWKFSNIVDGFIQPVSTIAVDENGIIWAAHFHKGLYRIELDKTLSKVKNTHYYTSLSGDGPSRIGVYNFNNRVVFCDSEAIYTTDEAGRVIKYDALNNQLGLFKSSIKIVEVSPLRYWFIRDDIAGLFHLYDGILQEIDEFDYSIFNEDLLREQKSIYPIGSDDYIVGLDGRFAVYQARKALLRPRDPLLIVNRVTTFDDVDGENRLPLNPIKQPIIKQKQDKIVFNVSSPGVSASKNYQIYYRLVGLANEFTKSTTGRDFEFNNIPAGNYTFESMLWYDGKPLQHTLCSYSFTVARPMLTSKPFILVYAIIGVIIFCSFIFVFVRLVKGAKNEVSEDKDE